MTRRRLVAVIWLAAAGARLIDLALVINNDLAIIPGLLGVMSLMGALLFGVQGLVDGIEAKS